MEHSLIIPIVKQGKPRTELKNGIIPVKQSGFRKGRSTIDHLVKRTKISTLATFVDGKKAYDKVWHARLLFKLKSNGLSGNIMYSYLRAFLSNRSIPTRVGTSLSSTHSLNMGIPQGSIIAPILFNILLLHDLPKCISKKLTLVQYAVDIANPMHFSLRKDSKEKCNILTDNLSSRY